MGAMFIQGATFIIFAKCPGATFIPGATSIVEWMNNMVIRVVEFSSGSYKIRNILCQKSSHCFFIEEYQFRSTIFVTDIF